MRIVFDTNVWISAYAFKGRLRALLDRVIEDKVEVAVSQAILDEMAYVLRGVKFKMSADRVETLMREIRDITLVVHPKDKLKVVERDPDDDCILECAVAAEAEVIVTGDENLLALGSFRGIRILTPNAFLDGLEGKPPGPPELREPQAAYTARKRAGRKKKPRKG